MRILLALLLAALLLPACGDDDEGAAPSQPETTTTATATATASVPSTAPTAPTEGPTDIPTDGTAGTYIEKIAAVAGTEAVRRVHQCLEIYGAAGSEGDLKICLDRELAAFPGLMSETQTTLDELLAQAPDGECHRALERYKNDLAEYDSAVQSLALLGTDIDVQAVLASMQPIRDELAREMTTLIVECPAAFGEG